ncbi:MAG: EAL domain-containing protein, partial [Rhodocyclaceae bacterium]|nr:EAL domain-containing protein [Rhodocyclaceae bacterium]
MPEGGLVASEYAATVELVRQLRDASVSEARAQVRHWLLPASRVSADFFCSAEHPKFGWFGFLADASGHGLPAAVFALHLPLLFREAVQHGLSLAAIYTRIDRFLLQQRLAGHFVCGVLVRVCEREIEILNAGMPDALLFAADGRLAEAFPSRHMPFGIDAGGKAAEILPQRYRLARGEHAALLLYSDGLSELGILSGNAFGRDGVLAAASEGAAQVFERLVQRVSASAAAIHDDVSVVMIPAPLDGEATGTPLGGDEPPEAQLNEAAMRKIIEHLDRGLLLTDAEERILYVNPAFTTVTGYTLAEAVGQPPRLLNSGRHDATFYRQMWHALQESGRWSGEIWNRRKDGSLYLEWLDLAALTDPAGLVSHYLGVFTVITQKKAQEERLNFLALHDPLTGLANRLLLADRGKQAICRADRAERSLAVLFINLDRFKSINDSLGHDIGDEVLVKVAQRLGAVLREDDTLARFGGDEFVCLLPDIADRHDAGLVANKLLAALDRPIEVAGHHFKIGASIGISAYPSDGRVFDDLIVRADRAMLRAKQAGGNMAKFFSAEMAVAVERQLELEARLDAAIKADQLVLYYQPKLELTTRRIVGAEALVRWHDPHDGLVPPGVFIPVAERSDLIAKIGNWVLREACWMLARRAEALPADFHVAVNVSPLQFERCDLAGEVARVLDETGVPPQRLQLEVTESLIIRDTDGVAQMLRRIAEMGVSVALDDFGTGYSNLGSLSHLPLDAFKLDQSFVRAIDADRAKESIARSV